MNPIYFDTRTLARNAVAELNGKFKDFGTDAPKGKRWAVLVEERPQVNVDKLNEVQDNFIAAVDQTQQIIEEGKVQRENIQRDINEMQHNMRLQSLANSGTMPAVSFTPGIKRRPDLKSVNGKPVRVMVRRSQVAIRLAKHIDTTA